MRIAIIDYGAGNTQSVKYALEKTRLRRCVNIRQRSYI